MAIAKVVYKSSASATPETWMDVTDDTVNAGNLLYQETATRNDGVRVTGTVDLSTKQDLITANGILKGNGSGTITAATPGTDYDHTVIVDVSGTTPSITGAADTLYKCGTCSTLSISVPSSGIIDVIFTSGSTATVLTVTPPTGKTIKWPGWFNPVGLDSNTTYEINIMEGEYGAVTAWT